MRDPGGSIRPFPEGFLWGTATAAHQVEGENRLNDWWAYEQEVGFPSGQVSGRACDQFHRYPEDFDRAREMGNNAHRLSIEWSRLEPAPGEWDEGAWEHYRRVFDALRERGLEPVVTLHHFTNPRWLAAEGGWLSRRAVGRFRRFAGRVARYYGAQVRWWIPFNEPNVYAYQAYAAGIWPPARRSLREAFRVLAHMMRAHAAAYWELHEHAALAPRVGIAHHVRRFEPASARPADRIATRLLDALFHRSVLAAVHEGRFLPPLGIGQVVEEAVGTLDFLGINYYTGVRIRFSRRHAERLFTEELPVDPQAPRSDLGWEVYPEGLRKVLLEHRRLGLPILITENGIADADDDLRPAFLLAHLLEAHRAIQEGVDVRGYFHWSLIDNYEWAEGFGPRFGLVEVDYETLERRPRPSARLYAEICRANAISRELVARWAPELLERYGWG